MIIIFKMAIRKKTITIRRRILTFKAINIIVRLIRIIFRNMILTIGLTV